MITSTPSQRRGQMRRMGSSSATAALSASLHGDARRVQAPTRHSFHEFLVRDAMVPGDSSNERTRGTHQPFTFVGREALHEIVATVDMVLGNFGGAPIKDARISLAGGAQFGKTVLQHSLMAYATGQRFRSTLMFLPDIGLVADMVQTKFRPNVVDQLPWFADMIHIGVAVTASGRSLHRLGAFSVTDGVRRCIGMFAGLGKVPTSISGDIALEDEVDDIEPKHEKFVEGRLGASDLRFIFRIGTQRVHGRGMNKAWRDGSQGVIELACPKCKHRQNPEDAFPGIVCLSGKGRVASDEKGALARLTYAGDFRVGDEVVATYEPGQSYFLGCVRCGAELDRTKPEWTHRKPDQLSRHNWSFRLSQLGIGAIELSKIVRQWVEAVEDDEKMIVFRCDVLGLPRSTAQKLEPDIIDRARTVEVYEPAPPITGAQRFAGLDMGQRCWFTAREVHGPARKRIVWAESIPLHQVGGRVPHLMNWLGIGALCIDQMPETKESRSLALAINGLNNRTAWPKVPPTGRCTISFGDGRMFRRDERGVETWVGMKAFVVRFDRKKTGMGIDQTIDLFTDATGREIGVPMIQCNRFESVDAVVREFLTPKEGEFDVIERIGLRNEPAMRLPHVVGSMAKVWEEFDAHHIAGSERDKDEGNGELGEYVDQVPNHFLFANAYSRLAEIIGGRVVRVPFASARIETRKPRRGGV